MIIINGSARESGYTSKLIDTIISNGLDAKQIKLCIHTISHYNYDGNYPETDEFISIIETIIKHKTIVFATPVYWYSMSGHLKIFFDRLTDLITSHKELGEQLKNKNVIVVTSSAGDNLDDDFLLPFKHTAEYLGMNFIRGKHFSKKYTIKDISEFITLAG